MHPRRALALRVPVLGLALVTAGAGGFLSACRGSHDEAAKARVDAVQASAAAAAEDSAPILSPRNTTEELIGALDSPSEPVRLLALRSLGFKDDLASAVPALVACLDDPSEKIARASRDVLAGHAYRNPNALDLELVDRLLNGEYAGDVNYDETGMLLVASLGKRGPESITILGRAVERGGRLGIRAGAALAAFERARR
jgi:HEAT repeat protein